MKFNDIYQDKAFELEIKRKNMESSIPSSLKIPPGLEDIVIQLLNIGEKDKSHLIRCIQEAGLLQNQVPVPVSVPVPVARPQARELNFYPDIFKADYLNYAVSNLTEFKMFINSRDFPSVIMNIKRATGLDYIIDRLNKKVIKSREALCLTPRFFFTYAKNEAQTFNTKYKFSNIPFVLLTDIPSANNKISFPDKRGVLTGLRRRIYYNLSKVKKEQSKKCIEDTIKNGNNFVYYETNFIIENIPPMVYILGDVTYHRAGVILDFRNYKRTKVVDVYYMESSITEGVPMWILVEDIILESIKQDIEVNLGLRVNIITFDMESCPRIGIQGNIGTCALWSLFLFYAYVLTPNRKAIFEQLKSMSNTSRDILLALFVFSLYKLEPVLLGRHTPHNQGDILAAHFRNVIKAL